MMKDEDTIVFAFFPKIVSVQSRVILVSKFALQDSYLLSLCSFHVVVEASSTLPVPFAHNSFIEKIKSVNMPRGTNSQGNSYNTPGGTNSSGGSSYHCK